VELKEMLMFSQTDKSQKDIHLKDYLFILLNRKWIAISFFIFMVTIVSFATFNQKPVYRATATVIVDAETPNVLSSVNEVVRLGESNYFAYRDYMDTQKEIIKSRRNAYKVFKKLQLSSYKEFSDAKDPLEALLKKITVASLRNTKILEISAEDTDPMTASVMANEFAKVYSDSNLALSTKTSNNAEDWLKKELEVQEKKVRDSEIEAQDYKEKNELISAEQKTNIASDALTKINESYMESQSRRIQIETAYKAIEEYKGELSLDNLPSILYGNENLQQLKQDYLKQEALLMEYKKVYKSKHPKMIALLGKIEHLKSLIKNELGSQYNVARQKLEDQYNVAKQEEAKFKNLLDEKKKEAADLERKTINYNALMRGVEINRKMLAMVLSRLKETSISSQIRANNIRIQDIAEPPQNPIKPKKKLNIALGIIMGLFGGITLAFFKEYMDTSLKDQSDITQFLDLPILGSVPRIKVDRKNIKIKSDIDRVVELDSNSIAAEAYRSIRTNLLFSLSDADFSNSIVITSSVPREGKTTTAANLAVMIALSGEKVLLVDADMRKPKTHSVFNLKNQAGLSDFLSGAKDFDSIINHAGVDNLSIITAGSISNRPAELLSSVNMKVFLSRTSSQFSKVIFDTPPITLVTDASILSSVTGAGVILVAESGRTTKELLYNSKELLRKVNSKIIGVVLNNVSLTKSGYHNSQYYYRKYYDPAQPNETTRPYEKL